MKASNDRRKLEGRVKYLRAKLRHTKCATCRRMIGVELAQARRELEAVR